VVNPLLRLACASGLSVLAAGCSSKATAYGAKFTFAYAASADFENFVTPIAPGAKLDVVVFANGTEERIGGASELAAGGGDTILDCAIAQTESVRSRSCPSP
jgi:hypothetical protein